MKILLSSIIIFALTPVFAADKIFDKVTASQPLCYGREYSSTHLANYPLQTVQKITAKLEKRGSLQTQDLTKTLLLEVTLKGKENAHKNYRAHLICYNESDMCHVECDGGKVQARVSDGGNLFIVNLGFVIEGGCPTNPDDENTETIFLKNTERGDDIFEMVPLPRAYCQK